MNINFHTKKLQNVLLSAVHMGFGLFVFWLFGFWGFFGFFLRSISLLLVKVRTQARSTTGFTLKREVVLNTYLIPTVKIL